VNALAFTLLSVLAGLAALVALPAGAAGPRPSPPAGCSRAARRVTGLQEEILHLKARHWALRLRLGSKMADALADADATIVDPAQRARYLAQLGAWRAVRDIPPLQKEERDRLAAVQALAKELVAACRP